MSDDIVEELGLLAGCFTDRSSEAITIRRARDEIVALRLAHQQGDRCDDADAGE